MGHPYIENTTPFAVEVLQLGDEQGRNVVVPVVKATFDIAGDALTLAEEQLAVDASGLHWGDPDTSAYKFEPETAFCKPATDVVLVGHAHAPQRGATRCDVGFRVGPLQKIVRVTGDRLWYKAPLGIAASAPAPFETLPLSYDRAYGGWDRTSPDESKHHCDPRNPVGRGYRASGAVLSEGSLLPNIEDPAHLLTTYNGKCVPTGVGFTGPNWQPRARLGGTYDEAWTKQRSPLLPLDFQRAFFNAASPGLIATGHLRGDEPVLVQGVQSGGATIATRLPGLVPPTCAIDRRSGGTVQLETHLDTVIVDSERGKLILLWRNFLSATDGLQGIAEIRVSCVNAPAPKQRPKSNNVVVLPLPRSQQPAV